MNSNRTTSFTMLKNLALCTACFALLLTSHAAAQTIDATGLTTTAVHISFTNLDSGDYYGSGNDDDFAEYGLTTFNISDANVTAINSATLSVTYNDRSFTDGTQVEFMFTPDSATTLGGDFAALSYDATIENGLNPAHYVTAPVSLGVFPFDPGAEGGSTLMYDLDLSSAGADMLAAVQNGTDFQIIVTATAAADDITLSGVGNTFDPGDPMLSLSVDVVPEPNSLGLLGLGLLGMMTLRRRR